jgi:F-type H+-transporting ATPase subunit a
MNLSPDEIVYGSRGFVVLNATVVYTWGVMALLIGLFAFVRSRLRPGLDLSGVQNLTEVVVENMRGQIGEIGEDVPDRYLSFVGTLFLFVLVSNVLSVVPGFEPPTASLSTTAALAICVFVAVPAYGIARRGIGGYLKQYVQPAWFMLPFNIIGDLSRTIALAVRLYGNVMSVSLIVGILLSLVPLFFPVVMNLLGLVTGVIQAYIFAVLAMVYIAAATRVHGNETDDEDNGGDDTTEN